MVMERDRLLSRSGRPAVCSRGDPPLFFSTQTSLAQAARWDRNSRRSTRRRSRGGSLAVFRMTQAEETDTGLRCAAALRSFEDREAVLSAHAVLLDAHPFPGVPLEMAELLWMCYGVSAPAVSCMDAWERLVRFAQACDEEVRWLATKRLKSPDTLLPSTTTAGQRAWVTTALNIQANFEEVRRTMYGRGRPPSVPLQHMFERWGVLDRLMRVSLLWPVPSNRDLVLNRCALYLGRVHSVLVMNRMCGPSELYADMHSFVAVHVKCGVCGNTTPVNPLACLGCGSPHRVDPIDALILHKRRGHRRRRRASPRATLVEELDVEGCPVGCDAWQPTPACAFVSARA